jgi:hypothetical protein
MKPMGTYKGIGTVLYLCFGLTLLLADSKDSRLYQIESARIEYSIHGGGILAPELNLTIEGEGKLRFRDWGRTSLVEEETQERTSGILSYAETFSRYVKYNQKEQWSVDYGQGVILERAVPKGKRLQNLTKGMTPHGKARIAGKECDVWAKEGERVCLYKGVPLLIERELFGISYEKRAHTVNEDINISSQECTLPDFPVRKIALFKTSIKQKKGVTEIAKQLEGMVKELSGKKSMELQRHKRHYLNRLGENIFRQQKVVLPVKLERMKRARECLQLAENSFHANGCLEAYGATRHEGEMKEEVPHIGLWSAQEKRRIMERFDEKIAYLASKMKCIRAAKHIDDLSRCMTP